MVNTVLVEKMGTKLKSEKTAVQQAIATNQESYTREKEEDHPPLPPEKLLSNRLWKDFMICTLGIQHP